MSEEALYDEAPEARPVRGRSLWEGAFRRLMRNPAAVVSAYVVAILVLLAAFGPMLWVHPAPSSWAPWPTSHESR